MLPLRLCYLILDCLFDEYCSLPTSHYKDFTDTLLSGFNVSRVRKPGSLHSPLSDEGKVMDECLQSIQANESDTILMPYTLPVMLSNVKTGPVFFSDKITILSTYKVEKDNPNPGIFDTFHAFGADVLALSLNFFVIYSVLICLTYILERKSLSRRVRINGRRLNLRFVPWFIFRFFVKQYPSFPGNMTLLKVLLTCCLLLFSYFITFFYAAMIKTEMVTVKAPRVIVTYQDIVDDPSIEPYIRHTFDEYKTFKEASAGSVKRKIWERIVKMGVGRLVYTNRENESTSLLDTEHPFMKTKAVILTYSSLAQAMKYSSALYFKTLENRRGINVRGLGAIDPTESEKVSTIVINRLTSKVLSHKYEVRIRRFFEGNLWHKVIENGRLQYAQLTADFLRLGKDISDADEFAGEKVVLSQPMLMKPNFTYFMSLLISYLILCVLQFILFLIERWVSAQH